MARLLLVRHGKSAKGFHEAVNSGLSEIGHEVAEQAAAFYNKTLPKQPVLTSPMLRAVETATPLSSRWDLFPEVCRPIDEIPVPEDLGEGNLAARRPWLDRILKERYGALGPEIENWRRELLAFVSSVEEDCIAFTHYLTINAVCGAAIDDPNLDVINIGYCCAADIFVDAGRIEWRGIVEPHG